MPVATVILFAMLLAQGSAQDPVVHLELKVEEKSAKFLDALITVTLVNSTGKAVSVHHLASPFPFDLEMTDRTGGDALSEHRKPLPPSRKHHIGRVSLASGERKALSITVAEYLALRSLPSVGDRPRSVRAYFAMSLDGTSGTFGVVRSNSVEFPLMKEERLK